MKRSLIELFADNIPLMNECLEITKTTYRSYDPAYYLYNQVLAYDYENKFTHDFVELLYVTLTAWGMNSRKAKLSEFDIFENTILSHKEDFDKLKDKKIISLDNDCLLVLNNLFVELELVASDVPLVTFSKAMHFILPELIGPIDRRYTITFFDGYQHIDKDKESQFFQFMQIHTKYAAFAKKVDLSSYINKDSWNRSIPKIIDNIIIGYMKKNGEN